MLLQSAAVTSPGPPTGPSIKFPLDCSGVMERGLSAVRGSSDHGLLSPLPIHLAAMADLLQPGLL